MKLVLALVILVLASSTPAEACKLATPSVYTPTPLARDVVAPSIPTVEWTLREPKLPDYLPFGCSSMGRLVVKVSASDDQTAAHELGYRVVIRGRGMMMRVGEEALLPREDGTFVFPYKEALDLEIEVRAVDRNGNVGAPTTITVDTVTAEAHALWVQLAWTGLVLLIVIVARVRRRLRAK